MSDLPEDVKALLEQEAPPAPTTICGPCEAGRHDDCEHRVPFEEWEAKILTAIFGPVTEPVKSNTGWCCCMAAFRAP